MGAISHLDQAPLLNILEVTLFAHPMFCNLQKIKLQNMLKKKIIEAYVENPSKMIQIII